MKDKSLPAAMAVSVGWMSEHERESILQHSSFVIEKPVAYSDEAHCTVAGAALAVGCELPDRCMGHFALACSSYDALGLDERGEGDLPRLFVSMSPASRKVVLSIRQAGNVFVSRNPNGMAKHF